MKAGELLYWLINLLKSRFHHSYIFPCFCAGALAGLLLAPYSPLLVNRASYVMAFSLLALAGTLKSKSLAMIILSIVLGSSVGLMRGGSQLQTMDQLGVLIGSEVQIKVRIKSLDYNPEGAVSATASDIVIDTTEYSGEVWMTAPSLDGVSEGDIIQAIAIVDRGFGTYTISVRVMSDVNVIGTSETSLIRVKQWFASNVTDTIRQPEADLGIGFLLGEKGNLPDELLDQLRAVGLTHIIVASGYNLTVLISLARRYLHRISRYSALIGSQAVITIFILITGFSPSMLRAGIVATFSLLAWYFTKSISPYRVLLYSACVSGLLEPRYLWTSVGWYLSFGAFFGVIILSPLLREFFTGSSGKELGVVGSIFFDTLSAQLATLPIILHVFGEYSLVSLVTNILILPLVPLAMVLVAFAGLFGFVGFLQSFVGLPAELILRYMTQVTRWFSGLEYANRDFSISFNQMIGVYIVLIFLTLYLHRAVGKRLYDTEII
jgi:competence protein ComEC